MSSLDGNAIIIIISHADRMLMLEIITRAVATVITDRKSD
jgi:hypothetical protein